MIKWLKEIAEGIRIVVDGIVDLVSSIGTMVKWVGKTMSFAGGDFMQFVPAPFLGLALVLVSIYLAKLLLGASNK